MNTSQHKVLKQNQSIDIPNGSNSPSLSASLSNMRLSGDMGTPQIENQNNAVQNNNQVPNATQSNFEEHILLYNVLQQLTRKVQERDQLNEVLEQENVKLKYMLMTALNYCYDTIGNTQKAEGTNNLEYPRRNSNNTDPNYSSSNTSRLNVSSSNSSSRKGSTEDYQGSPRPDTRRDSQGMNLSPRQQAEMMGIPIAQESSPQYDMLPSRRRSSNTVLNTNPQYQQLETYVMGRKPSVEYHEPQQQLLQQQQQSYDMQPTHPERRRLSNNASYGLENYVMPTTSQRSSIPQMQPQQAQHQDVYGDLQNYVMKKANPHGYQQEVYHDEPVPSPIPPRRSSALPMENYSMQPPTSTSSQQSPYHNLDNYVMGGGVVQPQIQQPQEPYRRSSVQVPPQYIPSPTSHQSQQWQQQQQQQQQQMIDHQNQPYQIKERKRSTSNGTEYPLDQNYPTTRPHVYTPKTPVPQQEKYFNMNDQYRRASLAFPPSSRHNQRQMGEPLQRSVDMFNEKYMFPQQTQQQQPSKRMSNPAYAAHENYVFPQQQPQMDFSNYRMTSDYSPKISSKKKKDRNGDERRQSYGSQQQQQLPSSMTQQQGYSQQQQQLQTPPPSSTSQLTCPDKVFGGDASVIPARRSSVIYTPGPSPKELRQQQQQKEKERQQQLLQQQQKEEKVDSVSTAEDCETYVSDDVSPVGNGQQQNQIVDDNASFVTYFSDSD